MDKEEYERQLRGPEKEAPPITAMDILLLWEAGEITEGYAARLMGLNRLEARHYRLLTLESIKQAIIPEQR